MDRVAWKVAIHVVTESDRTEPLNMLHSPRSYPFVRDILHLGRKYPFVRVFPKL